jgi:hypothetical protein
MRTVVYVLPVSEEEGSASKRYFDILAIAVIHVVTNDTV